MLGSAISRFFAVWPAALAMVLSLAGAAAAQQPSAASASAATVPSGVARIWFYRDYEPYGSRNFAAVALNGAPAGYVRPDGAAFYRDVAPGRYHVTVDSAGLDVNQDRTVDLGPGQEALVKILASTNWEASGDETMYQRDTFYVSLVPPQIGRAQLATHPLTGRGG